MGDRIRAAEGSRLGALLDGIDTLPPLPPVARELMSLGDLEHVEIEQIARLIELDPGLAGRVIGMCRAAHTGLGDRVRTVRQATVMLGVDCIRRLVLSAQVCEMLREQAAALDDSGRTMGLTGFDRDGFWVHCVGVAVASERLAARLPGLIAPDRAFVAGLLHGIGRLALELVAPRAMSRIMELAAREGVPGARAERRVLGIDHHEAGRRLAARWGLPDDVIEVIGRHDAPGAGQAGHGEHDGIVNIAALAKWACRRYHLGWSGDWHDPGDARDLCDTLGLNTDTPAALMPEIISACGRRLADLGFIDDAIGAGEMAMLIAAQANRQIEARRWGERTAYRRAGQTRPVDVPDVPDIRATTRGPAGRRLGAA